MRKGEIASCEICGGDYLVKHHTQKYCGAACKREAGIIQSRMYRSRQRKTQPKQKTEWAEITAKCKAAGKSYGQMVSEGRL